MTAPIPPTAAGDRYRIVLIGHSGVGVGLGSSSPVVIATLILASVRLLSLGYPNLSSSSNI